MCRGMLALSALEAGAIAISFSPFHLSLGSRLPLPFSPQANKRECCSVPTAPCQGPVWSACFGLLLVRHYQFFGHLLETANRPATTCPLTPSTFKLSLAAGLVGTQEVAPACVRLASSGLSPVPLARSCVVRLVVGRTFGSGSEAFVAVVLLPARGSVDHVPGARGHVTKSPAGGEPGLVGQFLPIRD